MSKRCAAIRAAIKAATSKRRGEGALANAAPPEFCEGAGAALFPFPSPFGVAAKGNGAPGRRQRGRRLAPPDGSGTTRRELLEAPIAPGLTDPGRAPPRRSTDRAGYPVRSPERSARISGPPSDPLTPPPASAGGCGAEAKLRRSVRSVLGGGDNFLTSPSWPGMRDAVMVVGWIERSETHRQRRDAVGWVRREAP
jgi:hypothetical protein